MLAMLFIYLINLSCILFVSAGTTNSPNKGTLLFYLVITYHNSFLVFILKLPERLSDAEVGIIIACIAGTTILLLLLILGLLCCYKRKYQYDYFFFKKKNQSQGKLKY